MNSQCHLPNSQRPKDLVSPLGDWLDQLGRTTEIGKWQVFGTITFATPEHPWRRGFPVTSYRPHPDFAHRLFNKFITHLEGRIHQRVDYVVADQLGSKNGRFHQHYLLSAKNLCRYPRKAIWQWFYSRAGFNRVLPFKNGASQYIARFVGDGVGDCEWNVSVGPKNTHTTTSTEVGRVVVVESADMPSGHFRRSPQQRERFLSPPNDTSKTVDSE